MKLDQPPKLSTESDTIKTSRIFFIKKPMMLTMSRYPATLAWHADNTISLVIDSTEEILFHCRPTNVVWFRANPWRTKIKLTNGQKFRFIFNKDFHESHKRVMMAGILNDVSRSNDVFLDFFIFRYLRFLANIIRVLFGIEMYKSDANSDASWWVMILKACGIRASHLSLIKFTAGLSAVIFFSILIGAVVQIWIDL